MFLYNPIYEADFASPSNNRLNWSRPLKKVPAIEFIRGNLERWMIKEAMGLIVRADEEDWLEPSLDPSSLNPMRAFLKSPIFFSQWKKNLCSDTMCKGTR